MPLDHQASDAPTKTKKQKRKAVPKGRKTGQGGDGDATKDHTAPEAVNESWQEQEVTDEPSGEGVDRGRGEAPPSSPAVLPSRKRAVVADSEEE